MEELASLIYEYNIKLLIYIVETPTENVSRTSPDFKEDKEE